MLFYRKSNLSLYPLYYAEACNELAGIISRHCASATQLILKKYTCSGGEPLTSLCPIWPVRNLNLRPPAPKTNALSLDQQACRCCITIYSIMLLRFIDTIFHQLNFLISCNYFTILCTNENQHNRTKYNKKLRKVQFQRMHKMMLQDLDQPCPAPE